MSMTDPLADMLTRIRNANRAKQERIDVPSSKLKEAVAGILKREGFIKSYRHIDDHRQGILRIRLHYDRGEGMINGMKRVSKPGSRAYVGKDDLPRIYEGLGIAIISTSRGIMTDEECRQAGAGGEVLCYVW